MTNPQTEACVPFMRLRDMERTERIIAYSPAGTSISGRSSVRKLAILGIAVALWIAQPAVAQTTCGDRSATAVQVLGSGGPMHAEGRGSASYILWHKGRPSVLVDAGAGTSVALAKLGIDESDLETVLITHLHPDHISDLPDLLWSMLVEDRHSALSVAGPSGSADFPGIETFVAREFGPSGAFPFMSGVLEEKEFKIQIKEIDARHGKGAEEVLRKSDLKVTAYPVQHGRAPTLAYRIEGPDFSVVFAADQTMRDKGFARFAFGSDLLVVHAILSIRGKGNQLSDVVALPEDLAETADEAKPKSLLLGHLMSQQKPSPDEGIWSLADITSISAAIRKHYTGLILFASDLGCYPL